MEDVPIILFSNRQEWHNWLEQNHNKSDGIWLIYYKKNSKKEGLSYSDAVEEALCFGWIDSLVKSIDGEKYRQKYTPRRKNSVWSKTNKDRVEKLIKEGKMTHSGLVKVEEAKKNGLWEKAYSSRLKPEIPEDLIEALNSDIVALQNFSNFADSYQTTYIYWLNSAKRKETRAKRIDEIVKLALKNKKPGII